MIWPIFIPSKSRSQTQKTGKLLNEDNIEFKFVVEPQEVDAYSKFGNVMSLGKNDNGLVFSRQSILNHARSSGIKWFWMMDDDISGFYKSNGKKNSRVSAKSALIEAQMILSGIPNLGQGSLEYQQYSWSAKNPIKLNGYCDVCVCINVERTIKCNYRKEVTLKEDRDFTLQVLHNGNLTARSSQVSFSVPRNGSNKGGLHDIYSQSGREEAASKKMEEIWGIGICKSFTKPDGRKDVKINWANFKSKT